MIDWFSILIDQDHPQEAQAGHNGQLYFDLFPAQGPTICGSLFSIQSNLIGLPFVLFPFFTSSKLNRHIFKN